MNERLKRLQHPFFNNIQDQVGEFVPFYYERQLYQEIASEKPWEESERFIAMILKEWDQLKNRLKSAHQQRDKQEAEQLMVLGVALLVQYVYWLNEKPVSLDEQQIGDGLVHLPFNFADRLQFIMGQPALHLAFIQLIELMNEVIKLDAKNRVRKKHSKH